MGRTIFLRSFLVQGSWNYRTLLGCGVAWALLPLIRRTAPGERRALIARTAEPFNAHPYLCPLALGALVRAEEEGADPDLIRRFRNALRSPLGSLGDAFIWATWRPITLLTAILVALLGGSPAAAVLVFLVLFNSVHLALRGWGVRAGLEMGFGVGAGLARLRLPEWTERITPVGVLVLGLAVGALLGRGVEPAWHGAPWFASASALLFAGYRGGESLRRWGPALLLILVMVVFLIGSRWVGAPGG